MTPDTDSDNGRREMMRKWPNSRQRRHRPGMLFLPVRWHATSRPTAFREHVRPSTGRHRAGGGKEPCLAVRRPAVKGHGRKA